MFLIRSRSTGRKVWVPLPNRQTAKGAASAPEQTHEVLQPMLGNIDESCFLGADSGPALQAGARAVGAIASAVVHSQDVFTPLLTLPKANLKPHHLATMRRFASKKWRRQTVKETRTGFKLLGGDNSAEGVFGQAKQQLRRVNALGRKSAVQVSKSFLASQWLLHRPGLLNLLRAFRAYRAYHLDELAVDPYDQLTEARPWEKLEL